MNNQNIIKLHALFLAVVCGATGCSSDASDQNDTDSTVAHASAPNKADDHQPLTAGGGSSTSTKTSGGNTAPGGSSPAPLGGESGTSQPVSTGGSTPNGVGGNSEVGGSAPAGGSNATGGMTSIGYGTGSVPTISIGGATGGTNLTQCIPMGQACSNVSDCCQNPGYAMTCNGVCGVQLVQATGGTTSTVPPTGGKTSVGGSNATGGSSASTGGASSTGGSTVVASGGSSASTGGNTGTGGSSVCMPAARPVPTNTNTAQLNCGTPVRDTTFPETALNFADRVAARSSSDVWVLGKTYDYSHVTHWNGVSWSAPLKLTVSYDHSELNAIVLDDTYVWVGGHAECAGCSMTPKVVRGHPGTNTWVDISSGLPSWGEVVSLWQGESRIFALVNHNNSAHVYELTKHGGTDMWFVAATFEGMNGQKIWGTSPNDLMVVGWKNGASNIPAGAFMTHFDGCSWNTVSMPSDLVRIAGIHGADGHVIVTAYTGSAPVRMISTDLANWTRSNGDGSTQFEGPVWMMNSKSVLIGGDVHPNANGTARLTFGIMSWSSSVIDNMAEFVADIFQVPSTGSLFIASATLTGESRLYRVTCQ